MKSNLLKATMLATAALVMGAMATSTQAKNYTFGTASGGSYCDGVSLTTSDKVAYAGVHLGSVKDGCLSVNDDIGGYVSKLGGEPQFQGVLTYPESTPNGYGLYVSFQNKVWALYLSNGTSWGYINSGPLLNGAPAEHHPMGAKGARSAIHPMGKAGTYKPY